MRQGLVAFAVAFLGAAVAGATTLTSVSPNGVRMGSQFIVTGTGMTNVFNVYIPTEFPPGSINTFQTQTLFTVLDDQHISVYVLPLAIPGDLRIDANFQPGLTIPYKLRTENDYTGDGRADLLLMNANSEVVVWGIDCGRTVGIGYVATIPPGFQFVGTADFDGDNHSDILWRDANGDYGIWLMVNNQIVGSGPLPALPAGVSLAGTGDIDGDSKADIILRDSVGGIGAWLMNGLTITAGGYIGSTLPATQILGIGDFDDDGKFDIAFIDQNGGVGRWLLNGFTVVSGAFLGNAPAYPGTTFELTRDFDGNGDWDLMWRSPAPGVGGCGAGCEAHTFWFMQGGNVAAISVRNLNNLPSGDQRTYGPPLSAIRYPLSAIC
jgi:hypothetical protein